MALTESTRAGEFLIAEANGTLSRDKVVVASGAGALVPGTVLGKVTASGKYAAYAPAETDGTEVAAAILYAPVDATAADADAVVIARHAEVDESQLTGIDSAGSADLAALQIIVR